MNDFFMLKPVVMYGVKLDFITEFAADVNEDGKVSLADAAKIQAVVQNKSQFVW